MEAKLLTPDDRVIPFEEALADLQLRRKPNITVTDFDETLTLDDVGVQIFLQQILHPTEYWFENPEEFRSLLLPRKYQQLLEDKPPELPPNKCKFALELAEDLGNLYQEIQNNIVDPDPRLISEFAFKMIYFDQTMISMDSTFAKNFDGAFLLRTRFLKDRTPLDLSNLAEQACKESKQAQSIELPKEDQIGQYKRRITANHPLIKSPRLIVRPRPTPRPESLAILRQIRETTNSGIRIITTNEPGLVAATVRNHPALHSLLMTPGMQIPPNRTHPLITGTRLQTRERIYEPKPNTPPVFGIRKAEIAHAIAEHHSAILAIGIGDSATGDGPMLRAAQLGIMVPKEGKNPEQTRAAFHNAGSPNLHCLLKAV